MAIYVHLLADPGVHRPRRDAVVAARVPVRTTSASWAVLLSTLMFTQIHLHLTPAYAIAVFFPSLFWGALYARHRTLVGVSVSHILIGIYVAFFLGLPLMVH